MGRREDLQNPKYHLVRCCVWLTIFFVFVPPLIVIGLFMVDQTSITLSIKDFYISTNASNSNQSIIHFDLSLGNSEDYMQVYYDNLNLTFSYNVSGGFVPVGNYTIHAFHQGLNKQTERKDYVVMTNGNSWQEISKNVSPPSSGVVFRVDLSGAVKFREMFSRAKSKKRKIMAWANVEVDRNTGKKIRRKSIELKHLIVHHTSGGTIAALVIVIFASLFLPCWLCPLLICCRKLLMCCREVCNQ